MRLHTNKKKLKKSVKPVKMDTCPSCGLERPEGERTYNCVNCGKEGFDCCVAGNSVKCFDCEQEETDNG